MYLLMSVWFFYVSLQLQPLSPSLQCQSFSPNHFQLQNFNCHLPAPSVTSISWRSSNVTPQSQAFSLKLSFARLQSQPVFATFCWQPFSPNPSFTSNWKFNYLWMKGWDWMVEFEKWKILNSQKIRHTLPNLNDVFTIYVTATVILYYSNMYIYILYYIMLYYIIHIYIKYSSQSNLNTQYILFLYLDLNHLATVYSSLTISLFGNNGDIDELRVLNSIELFMYPSYYCKHPCFLSLSQTFEKAETPFFYYVH